MENNKLYFYIFIEMKLKFLSYKIDEALDSSLITTSEHYTLWSRLVDFIEEVEDLKNEVHNENK